MNQRLERRCVDLLTLLDVDQNSCFQVRDASRDAIGAFAVIRGAISLPLTRLPFLAVLHLQFDSVRAIWPCMHKESLARGIQVDKEHGCLLMQRKHVLGKVNAYCDNVLERPLSNKYSDGKFDIPIMAL